MKRGSRRPILAIAVSLLLLPSLLAQISTVETCTSVGSLPHASVLANMDNANGLDVVVTNESSGTVQVLLNNGSGTLTAGTPITVGTNPRGICTADFDDDGNADVAVANSGSGTISVIYGDGAGGSAQIVTVTVGGTPVDVAAILRSGDTVRDIVIADQGTFFVDGRLQTADNDANTTPGARAFSTVTTLMTGGVFESVAAGDATGTSTEDVVAANSASGASNGIHILDGGAALAPIVGSPFGAGTQPVQVTLADLTADGKFDPIVSSAGFLGTGGLRVLVTPSFSANTLTTTPGLAATGGANLDADTKGDLVFVPAFGDAIVYLGYNNGVAPDVTQTLTGIAGFHVRHGAINPTGSGGAPLCNHDEVVLVKKASDQVCIERSLAESSSFLVASTGCGGSPATSTSGGAATIGNSSFAVTLTGATPLRFALLLAQENATPGSAPTVFNVNGCGHVIDVLLPYVQVSDFTNAAGAASFAVPIPSSTSLLCREFKFQWAIFDGGAVAGLLTLASARIIRVGEY